MELNCFCGETNVKNMQKKTQQNCYCLGGDLKLREENFLKGLEIKHCP